MKKIIFLILLVALSFSTITITNLPESSSLEKLVLEQYTIAQYGSIPYGALGSASLILANPFDACEPLTNLQGIPDDLAPFVLIERGNCDFVVKSKNAADAGAKMAIIIDNVEEYSQSILMADDGKGSFIPIPSIFLEKDNGDTIVQYVVDKLKEDQSLLQMEIDFTFPQQDSLDIVFYIDILNRKTFQMLFNFKKHEWRLNNKYAIDLAYNFYYQGFGLQDVSVLQEEDCLYDKTICSINYINEFNPAPGRDVVNENLYEICLFKFEGFEKYLEYQELFRQQCIEISQFENCREDVIKEVGVNHEEILKCFESEEQIQKIMNHQNTLIPGSFGIFPSLDINREIYNGSFASTNILEAMCASVTQEKATEACKSLIKNSISRFERSPSCQEASEFEFFFGLFSEQSQGSENSDFSEKDDSSSESDTEINDSSSESENIDEETKKEGSSESNDEYSEDEKWMGNDIRDNSEHSFMGIDLRKFEGYDQEKGVIEYVLKNTEYFDLPENIKEEFFYQEADGSWDINLEKLYNDLEGGN